MANLLVLADFEPIFQHSFTKEGRLRWTDLASDRGGETYAGIARKKRPDSLIWPLVDSHKGKPNFPACLAEDDELTALVKDDYKRHYFERLGLAKFPHPIAKEVFDTALNQGPGAAATHLQRCLNALNREGKDYADVTADGDLGPATHAALQAYLVKRGEIGVQVLYRYLNSLQGSRYIGIAEKDPSQEANVFGWGTRVFEDAV